MSLKFKPAKSAEGTHLVGYIEKITYGELCAVMGQPGPGDEYKVAFEWQIQFEDGVVACVYDWKITKHYDDDGLTDEQIKNTNTEWNIGGADPRAVNRLRSLFPSADIRVSGT